MSCHLNLREKPSSYVSKGSVVRKAQPFNLFNHVCSYLIIFYLIYHRILSYLLFYNTLLSYLNSLNF